MADSTVFTTLRWPPSCAGRRVWAVSAIYGEAARLAALHQQIAERAQPGDRIVYLGNYLGRGAGVRETVNELMAFRRRFLALPHMFPDDLVYLRGCQEEMWSKLLQLQFATNPAEVLKWTLGQGVGATIAAYGGVADEGLSVTRQGAVAIGKWTQRLRQAMNQTPGHADFMASLKRAAFAHDQSLLFVSAGLDPTRPLSAQDDALWWGGSGFAALEIPGAEKFDGYGRVVRGSKPTGAPAEPGVALGARSATVDGGAGFGGHLLAACFAPDGERGGHLLGTLAA